MKCTILTHRKDFSTPRNQQLNFPNYGNGYNWCHPYIDLEADKKEVAFSHIGSLSLPMLLQNIFSIIIKHTELPGSKIIKKQLGLITTRILTNIIPITRQYFTILPYTIAFHNGLFNAFYVRFIYRKSGLGLFH